MTLNKDSSHKRRTSQNSRSNEPHRPRICSKWVVITLALVVFGFGAAGIYMYKEGKLPNWMITRTKENEKQQGDQKQPDDDESVKGDRKEQGDDPKLPEQDEPTRAPSIVSSAEPTPIPTAGELFHDPTRSPSIVPSAEPTPILTVGEPSSSPRPSLRPSSVPTLQPSRMPSTKPSPKPSNSPSVSLLPTPEITPCTAKGDYPNIDHLTFSVNALSGKSPSEQNIDRIGSQMFRFNDCLRFGLKDINKVDNCGAERQESINLWTTSTYSLAFQALSSGSDLDLGIDTSLNETIFPEQASGMGPTTVHNALCKFHCDM